MLPLPRQGMERHNLAIVNWYAPSQCDLRSSHYMPIRPSAFGQKWNIQVVVAPVIPKLIKGDVPE